MGLLGRLYNKQVLERLWRKGNPSTLLVGMQIGAATVENSVEFLQSSYAFKQDSKTIIHTEA